LILWQWTNTLQLAKHSGWTCAGGFASFDSDRGINLPSTVPEIWGSNQSSVFKIFKIRPMEVCRS